MSTYPERQRSKRSALDTHVGVVIVLGAMTIATSLHALATAPPAGEWLLFSALGLIAGTCAVKIPGVNALISASDTFFMASAMLFGPAPAIVSLALDSAGLAWRRGYGPRRLLFNATAPALSLWAATHVFGLLTGHQSLFTDSMNSTELILPLVTMTIVYFGLNSGLIAGVIALESRIALVTVWQRLAPLSLNYVAAASAAFCLLVVMRSGGILAASAVVPLVLVFHVTLRSILGRLADADIHVVKVERLYLSTIEALATAIEAKDGVTHDHIRRVQRFAVGLARALGIHDDDTIKAIKAAALLHDTGKLAVPEYILNKPGKLTAVEFEQMKLHVDVGADILSSIDFPYPVVPIVRAHHERWDGSGYPRGLTSEEIPIGARILSVVDCYDALTSDRPYRPALSGAQAMAIIEEGRGTMYDPLVVDTFLTVYRELSAEVLAPLPQQEALTRIGRAMSTPPAAPACSAEIGANAPEDLLAIVSLSRLLGGGATFGDAAALAAGHLSRILADSTCVFYVRDAASGRLAARYATGPHAAAVRGMSMAMGERLSGWVATCRQTIVNSDAKLDLGDRDVELAHALSTPLVDEDRLVGVLTAYSGAAQAFTEDQSRLVQMMAPHLGRIIGAAIRIESQRSAEVPEPRVASAGSRDLRVVFSK